MNAERPTCLLCTAPHCRRAATLPSGYRVWRCLQCGFEWIDRHELPNAEPSAIYQDYPYNRAIRRSFPHMRAHYLAGFRERVRRHFPAADLRSLRFLDFGCANGEYLATATNLGLAQVAGVEVDQTAADHARRFGMVASNLGLLDGEFDIVQIKNVISNIADFEGLVHDCTLRLKPGGILFLDVLNHAGFTSRAKKLARLLGSQPYRYGTLRPPFVINGFSKRNVVHLLVRNGLHPLSVRTSYFGSPEVPYANVPYLKVIGWVARLFGEAPVILTDSRKEGL